MRNSKVISILVRLVPPRREFILRSAGHVRYFGVGRFGQISFLFLVALTVGWIGFSSAGYVSNALVVAERNVRIATSDRVIRNMQEEINGLKQDIENRGRSIGQRETANRELAGKNTSLHDQIETLESGRDRLVRIRDERDREIARLNQELALSVRGREGISRQLNDAEKRVGTSQNEREKLTQTD